MSSSNISTYSRCNQCDILYIYLSDQKQGFESVNRANICLRPPTLIHNKSEISLLSGLWNSNRRIISECVIRYRVLFCSYTGISFYDDCFFVPSSYHRCKQLKKKKNTKTCLIFLCIIL